MCLREGHMMHVKMHVPCPKTFQEGRIIPDTSYPNNSNYPVEDNPNQRDFYPEAEEQFQAFTLFKGTKGENCCLCGC